MPAPEENAELTAPEAELREQAEKESERESKRDDFQHRVASAYEGDPWFNDRIADQEKLSKHAVVERPTPGGSSHNAGRGS